jgi:hypothetical protein
MTSPPLLAGILAGSPVVTNSIPWPIEGPPTPIGAPALNSFKTIEEIWRKIYYLNLVKFGWLD